MGYSRSIKVSILRRVLTPNNESITKVSEEMGLNDQTIRNWIKQASGSQLLIEETSPRFINAQEKYLLIKEAASISEAEKGMALVACNFSPLWSIRFRYQEFCSEHGERSQLPYQEYAICRVYGIYNVLLIRDYVEWLTNELQCCCHQ